MYALPPCVHKKFSGTSAVATCNGLPQTPVTGVACYGTWTGSKYALHRSKSLRACLVSDRVRDPEELNLLLQHGSHAPCALFLESCFLSFRNVPSTKRVDRNTSSAYARTPKGLALTLTKQALSPVSFGVYGCMGHLACFLVFLVPHSTFCLQNGALEGYSSSPALPRLEHFYQMASQAADLLRQALGQSLKTPLEGAPGGETSLFREGIAHHAHLRSGLVEDRQELSHPMQPPYDHDYQSLQEELLRVNDGPCPAAARWRWARDALDKTDQLDKDTLLSNHGFASGSSVLGHTPSAEASRSGASPDEVFYL